jgi:hypothetical protein
MKCYQILQDGECVAFVHHIAMARAIAACQPQGYYVVEEVEVGSPMPISRREQRVRKPSINQPGARGRRMPTKRPSHWIFGPTIDTIEQPQPHAR